MGAARHGIAWLTRVGGPGSPPARGPAGVPRRHGIARSRRPSRHTSAIHRRCCTVPLWPTSGSRRRPGSSSRSPRLVRWRPTATRARDGRCVRRGRRSRVARLDRSGRGGRAVRTAQFAPGEWTLLEQAAALLSLARQTPHEGERLAAYDRAAQHLAELKRRCGWMLPQQASAVLSSESRVPCGPRHNRRRRFPRSWSLAGPSTNMVTSVLSMGIRKVTNRTRCGMLPQRLALVSRSVNIGGANHE